MKNLIKNGYARRFASAVICCAVLSPVLESASSFAASSALSAASQETLRLGVRIYREGVLPSGEPLQATLKGGHSVPGTSFACVSCHLRSGLGSFEGGIFTPPTNAARLFKPLLVYSSSVNGARLSTSPKVVQQNTKSYQISHRPPKYTDESLAHALRSGIDSAGRIMNDVMPRYLLEDKDMEILITYLKALSADFSPGVSEKKLRFSPGGSETTLHFATIITDDVSLADQTAMLMPLENFVGTWNLTNGSGHSAGAGAPVDRSRRPEEKTSAPKRTAILKLSLSRWVLKGSPETWRNQLEKYYRKEPVFALLGGISNGEWQPIHQFCEENHIPSIFPITDFPVISRTDWYTLYLSKGYYQEGEGAARFLNDKEELKGQPIVQIVRDRREGRALSRGFLETWHDFGQKTPVTVILKAGEILTAKFLQQELAQEKPAAIILWDGPESLKALELLVAEKNRPSVILVSSSFLGKSMFSLNEKVRDFTYLTYPYGIPQSLEEKSRLPQDKSQSSMTNQGFNDNVEENADATTRIWQQSYILPMVLDMALNDMRGNYYRDNLLDVIGTFMDQEVRLYERLSFGPGQRYASKGCYVVQFEKSGLVKKNGRATQ